MNLESQRRASSGSHSYLLFIIAAANLAGFLFGFDASVINGTVQALANTFQTSAVAPGFAVGSVLLGSCAGALVAGQLTDRMGRKPVMLITAVLFAVSAAGAGAAPSAGLFILFRLTCGLGGAAAFAVAPPYVSAISRPPRLATL